MSKLDKLLRELCPDGVEYKTLGEIAVDIYRGAGITRDQVTAEGTPCVRYGEIYTTYGVWFDKCVSHTDESKLSSKKYFEHGDILFAITGESVDDIAKCCAYIGHEKCLAGGDIVVLKHNQDPKYLSYVLATTDARQQKSKGKVKSKVVHSSVPAIREIKVPIPPIEIQREIVRILDDYTENIVELQNQLTAEITARQRQYTFYRNKLLTYDSKTRIMPLKDVAEIERGTRVVRSQLTEDGLYPVFQNALTPMGYNDKANRLGNNTFLICAGAAGQIGYSDVDFWAADDCYTFKCCEKLENRYLFHVLKNNQHRIDAQVRRASIPRISREAVGNIRIPILPLDVQSRIVNVLDNFEKICSDLNIGLPAEIEARQKQYEYYRDKLLSFKEHEDGLSN